MNLTEAKRILGDRPPFRVKRWFFSLAPDYKADPWGEAMGVSFDVAGMLYARAINLLGE